MSTGRRTSCVAWWGFLLHAVLAFGMLAWLHWMMAARVPFAVEQIGSSYLIFFHHFPAALNTFFFYGAVLVSSVLYLATSDPVWDRRARTACEIGLLANAILLATGSVWAKAAWNVWWRWEDPRLMSAAVMFLIYLGYPILQSSVEDARRRRTFAAVFGILAFVNVPIVHYSIRWFGQVSHPVELDAMSDPSIIATRWFGVAAFLAFLSLVWRWRSAGEAVVERAAEAMEHMRALEERRVRMEVGA